MSSREIAELTGKMHTNVIADIRTMLDDLELGETKFRSSYMTEQNKRVVMFNLPKDLTITLVSGYSAPLRLKIVTRCGLGRFTYHY